MLEQSFIECISKKHYVTRHIQHMHSLMHQNEHDQKTIKTTLYTVNHKKCDTIFD